MSVKTAECLNVLRRLKANISKSGIDALLVVDEYNIEYATGFYIHGVIVLIPSKGSPLYFVDSMNFELARKTIPSELVKVTGISDLSREVKDRGIKVIGFDPSKITKDRFDRLSGVLSSSRFVSKGKKGFIDDIFSEMRKIKKDREIRALKKVAKKTIRIWHEVKRNVEVGMREEDIAKLIDVSIAAWGGKNSFPTIAATGVNTAYPHAVPGKRKLKDNEHFLADFGIRYNGYCSDLTRTWDKGRIDRQIKEFRKFVLQAHDNAIKKIKPGVEIGRVVKDMEEYFRKNNVSRYMLHGLGHGVGLEVHEKPFVGRGCQDRFRKGMIVTVEPGLYKRGLGGIREEDMVLVTGKGCEVLTR